MCMCVCLYVCMCLSISVNKNDLMRECVLCVEGVCVCLVGRRGLCGVGCVCEFAKLICVQIKLNAHLLLSGERGHRKMKQLN